jgi:hypothetical protein
LKIKYSLSSDLETQTSQEVLHLAFFIHNNKVTAESPIGYKLELRHPPLKAHDFAEGICEILKSQ